MGNKRIHLDTIIFQRNSPTSSALNARSSDTPVSFVDAACTSVSKQTVSIANIIRVPIFFDSIMVVYLCIIYSFDLRNFLSEQSVIEENDT